MNAFPPKRILVPMDMPEPSLAALEAAKFLARRAASASPRGPSWIAGKIY